MFPLALLNSASSPVDLTLTKLLLNFEGSNGSTTFIDESPSARTISMASGNPAVISTAEKPFGTSSLSVNSGAFIHTDASVDFSMSGLQVFTLECFIFSTMFTSAGSPLSTRNLVVYSPIEIRGDGRLLIANAAVNNWGAIGYGSGVELTNNAWNHIRVVADGVNIKIYVNGVNNNSSPFPQPNWPNVARRFYIGRGGDGFFNGYIKGVRFRNEVMNTGNFTPPNAPFTF